MSEEIKNVKHEKKNSIADKVVMIVSVGILVGLFSSVFIWDTLTYGPSWSPDRKKRENEVDAKKSAIPETIINARADTFVDSGDGFVKDTRTGLMWQKDAFGPIKTAGEAESYCRQLQIGGFNDWRLPTIEELENLYIGLGSAVQQSKDRRVKPFLWPGYNYLASGKSILGGYAQNFMSGGRFYPTLSEPYRMYVRAVRSAAPVFIEEQAKERHRNLLQNLGIILIFIGIIYIILGPLRRIRTNIIIRILTNAIGMAVLLLIIMIVFKDMTLEAVISWFFPFGLVFCLGFGFFTAIFKARVK